MMTSLAEMEKTAQDKFSAADTLEILNECADMGAWIDSQSIKKIQREQLGGIYSLQGLCIAAFAIVGIEIFCGLSFYCIFNVDWNRRRDCRTCCADICKDHFFKEFGYFMQLYKKG